MSLIQRQFFAETSKTTEVSPSVRKEDRILEMMSEIKPAVPDLELSWKLITIEKLDQLSSRTSQSSGSRLSTKPDHSDFVQDLNGVLCCLQHSDQRLLQTRLEKIAHLAISIWEALRRDNCKLDVDYTLASLAAEEWEFVSYEYGWGDQHSDFLPGSQVPESELPSEPCVLFPRVSAKFAGANEPVVFCKGLAISHNSAVFRTSLAEDEEVKKDLVRARNGSFVASPIQKSPTVLNRIAL